MKLLIVDDERIVVQFMIESIDWDFCLINQIFSAHSSVEAKKILLHNDIDIILCDIEMPGENGIELIHWVRAHNMQATVIFLTCHAKFEYAKEAIQLNCKDYLLVPVSHQTLTHKIRETVEEIEEERKKQTFMEYGEQWMQKITPATEEAGVKSQQLVSKIKKYIVDHIDDSTLSLTKLATIFYLNKNHLNRIFQQVQGETIGRYIIRQRMNMAAQLIQTDNSNIESIADRVGYSSYPYFVSSFKRFFGCTPKRYQGEQFTQK